MAERSREVKKYDRSFFDEQILKANEVSLLELLRRGNPEQGVFGADIEMIERAIYDKEFRKKLVGLNIKVGSDFVPLSTASREQLKEAKLARVGLLLNKLVEIDLENLVFLPPEEQQFLIGLKQRAIKGEKILVREIMDFFQMHQLNHEKMSETQQQRIEKHAEVFSSLSQKFLEHIGMDSERAAEIVSRLKRVRLQVKDRLSLLAYTPPGRKLEEAMNVGGNFDPVLQIISIFPPKYSGSREDAYVGMAVPHEFFHSASGIAIKEGPLTSSEDGIRIMKAGMGFALGNGRMLSGLNEGYTQILTKKYLEFLQIERPESLTAEDVQASARIADDVYPEEAKLVRKIIEALDLRDPSCGAFELFRNAYFEDLQTSASKSGFPATQELNRTLYKFFGRGFLLAIEKMLRKGDISRALDFIESKSSGAV